MLSALRRLAATWVAKALFAVLLLSFVAWGVGDTIRNFGRETAVARVGGDPIELEEAQAATRREMARLLRSLGPQAAQFEANPQVRAAVAQQAVAALILDRVIRQEGQRLLIQVPDAELRQFVFGIQGFRGVDGQFSRAVFDSFLRTNQLTEPAFLALIRADLVRQQIGNAVRAGATAPSTLAGPLLRWQDQQRAAQIVVLLNAAAPDPPPPDEAALRRFQDNNRARFSAPEYREVTLAVMTAALLTQEVEISDAELAQAYEQRRGQFEAPERRVLEQVLVQDEAKAKELAAAWTAGADFAAMTAQAEAAGGSATELGTVDRDGLPLPELATAAFAAAAGAITAPVHTDFGWHVIKVVRIEPPTTRELPEVRDELRAELVAEKAANLGFERSNRIEDAFAGGASVAEAAQRFNMATATVTTDATGHDREGHEVGLPVIEAARAPLLATIFATVPGAPPRLQESEAGFAAVEIKQVIAPALRPFEQVEAEVREAWIADEKRRAQETAAATLLAATREGGKTLAQAAQEAGLGSREVGAIRRQPEQAGTTPPELLAPLFELKLNEVTMVPTRDGFAVAQLLEITAPDPATDLLGMTRVRGEVEQSIAQDLEVEFMNALRARTAVRTNDRMIDQLAQP